MPDPTQSPPPSALPSRTTSIRLAETDHDAIARICKATRLSVNAVVALALNAFVDHVDRTGKLPAPGLRRTVRLNRNPNPRKP